MHGVNELLHVLEERGLPVGAVMRMIAAVVVHGPPATDRYLDGYVSRDFTNSSSAARYLSLSMRASTSP